jgi:hypothetical protein
MYVCIFMHTYIHTYMHIHIYILCVCVCVRVRVRVQAAKRAAAKIKLAEKKKVADGKKADETQVDIKKVQAAAALSKKHVESGRYACSL